MQSALAVATSALTTPPGAPGRSNTPSNKHLENVSEQAPWRVNKEVQLASGKLEAVLADVEEDSVPGPLDLQQDTSSLAATFCEEVKAKIKRLQSEVETRDSSIAALHLEMQKQRQQHE